MNSKFNKILLSITYILLSFVTILCASIFISSKVYDRAETVAAYAKTNCRIELLFAKDKVSHEAIQYFIDRDYFKYSKYYDEVYCDDDNNPFIIKDHYSKVLISDSSNNNYFNVELLKGEFPNDTSFIVSVEVAKYYSIQDAQLPVDITVQQKNHGDVENTLITVCGIFACNDNIFVNKPDFKHNVQSNYVMIGKNSNNLEMFGAYADIIGIFTDDIISNTFAINQYQKLMGGAADFIAYDDYSTTELNVNFTGALEMAKNFTIDYHLVLNINKIVLPIGIVSILLLLIISPFLFKNFPTNKSPFLNTYVFAALGFILALVVLTQKIAIVTNQGVYFLISMLSIPYLAIVVISLFTLIVAVDLTCDTNKGRRNVKDKSNEYLNSSKGLVTIIIPSYNGADYVQYAIESCLNQTYKNIEVIVIDDGSNDNGKTKEIVSHYSNVKYIRKENGGVSSALNIGIKNSNGAFINWLSHDDMLSENSISERIKFLLSYSLNEKAIISSSVQYIDSDGKDIFRIAAKAHDVSKVTDLLTSTVNGCSLLIPRSAFNNHEFKEGMVYMPDYEMWAKLIKDNYRFINVDKKLVKSRVHQKQITVNRNDLREKDFRFVFDTYVQPLFDGNNNDDLKKLSMCLIRRSGLHPFYKEYIERINKYLISVGYFNYWDKFEAAFNILFSKCVSFARKLTSK